MKKLFKVTLALVCLSAVALTGVAKDVNIKECISTQNAAAFLKLKDVPLKSPIIPL